MVVILIDDTPTMFSLQVNIIRGSDVGLHYRSLISSLKDRRYLNRSGLILFDGTVQSVSHYINNFMSFSIRLIDIYHYL